MDTNTPPHLVELSAMADKPADANTNAPTPQLFSLPSESILTMYSMKDEDEAEVMTQATPDTDGLGGHDHTQEQEHEHEHEHDHEHEHIFVSKDSLVCGRCGSNDSRCRTCTFDVVENWEKKCCRGGPFEWTLSIPRLLMFLLLIDLAFVAVEIALLYRWIPPAPDLGSSSLYQPREYICAYNSKARTLDGDHDSVRECCSSFVSKYPVTDIWGTGFVGNDAKGINIKSCMERTLWDNQTATSSSSSSFSASTSTSTAHHRQRRLLLAWLDYPNDHNLIVDYTTPHQRQRQRFLSSAHHYDVQKSRCYEASGKYMLTHEHLPVEVFFHWASTSILIIFLIELLSILYAMRVKQFFCGCRRPVAVHDPVYIIDQHTGEIVCSYGIANHVNHATGSVSVLPLHNVDQTTRAELRNAMRDLTDDSDAMFHQQTIASMYPTPPSKCIPDRNMLRMHNSVASIVGHDANNMSSKEMLLDQPYWNVFLYVEPDGSDAADSNCGTPGRSKCCCVWHNKFFVLDFFVVVIAIVLENYLDLSQQFSNQATGNDQDLAALTEASVILLLVRGWRFARVLHGFMETTRKLVGEQEEMEAEIQHRNALLRDVVRMNNLVEDGGMSDKEFRLRFLEAYSTPSHNFISEINQLLKEEEEDLTRAQHTEHTNKTAQKKAANIQRKVQRSHSRTSTRET
jgi:hypothetical protein